MQDFHRVNEVVLGGVFAHAGYEVLSDLVGRVGGCHQSSYGLCGVVASTFEGVGLLLHGAIVSDDLYGGVMADLNLTDSQQRLMLDIEEHRVVRKKGQAIRTVEPLKEMGLIEFVIESRYHKHGANTFEDIYVWAAGDDPPRPYELTVGDDTFPVWSIPTVMEPGWRVRYVGPRYSWMD